ncbi:MAG TPA: non-canonical purine NTP pyrophosphatase, partial [Holophagaceae bacterium]|nr:non-canonical purine NTP pyrophosphatase [Holophagaceae bacterium]
RYVCELVGVGPDGREVVVRGELAGTIAEAPRGAGGFGYDPVFVPEGQGRTFGELPAEVKHGLSHRARACAALRARLSP